MMDPQQSCGLPEPARFAWLRLPSIGRRNRTAVRLGSVDVCALIPEPRVPAALDSLVAEFRAVRSYRCRFRGDAARPNLDLISKDLRAALERLGHGVGRTTDGTRGVRWIEGSGNLERDEATLLALAPHLAADGHVQITSGVDAWFWTFESGTARRFDGVHPSAVRIHLGTGAGPQHEHTPLERSA